MNHPYLDAPDHAFWRRAVAGPAADEVDPATGFALRISPEDRIATAGSCFAQHISRHLAEAGFHYFVTEPGHSVVRENVRQDFGYGVFSARFGNIYTSRQLLQLMQRAYGDFLPEEDIWPAADGRFIDPFRPTIQPDGFATRRELEIDRDQHLAAVRRLFEELDVLVFTLGLTECWTSRADGAVFPLCPGVAGGTFDPDRHQFVNLTVRDVVKDMTRFLRKLRRVNPASRVVLTVSPVPLIATASDRHVLAATTYSKAVLRAAAEELTRENSEVHYFPSYEIVTGAHTRGAYFGEDLRGVREEGVERVMQLFLQHAADAAPPAPKATEEHSAEDALMLRMEKIAQVLCDEELLDAPQSS